jgi:hypothetical protein
VTSDQFRVSLTATEPPAGLTHALAGLWWDAKGDWARAQQRKGQYQHGFGGTDDVAACADGVLIASERK